MQKHLRNVVGLADLLGLLALATLGYLSPHLFHILQHHIVVSVKGLHMAQPHLVTADEYLGIVFD